MELDISSLWSWTMPLWGLFVLVFFLGGVLTTPVILEGIEQTGAGYRNERKVRHR